MLYGLTIFLSAFLLFQVQLIAGKQLLPWFGGTPAVWTTSLVFFQTLLLAGYAYAHGLARERDRRAHGVMHLLMLAAAVVPLVVFAVNGGAPLLPTANFKPPGSTPPVPRLLVTLGLSVGLPFLVLSSTSPLLQHWHSARPGALDRTYRLYGLSNAGSLLGLLSYPFLFEWLFDLRVQAWIWTALFAVYAAGSAVLAWRFSRSKTAPGESAAETAAAEPEAGGGPALRSAPAFWLLLPFLSSAALMATTNHLCQDLAVVPFLWVLPLALYLASFMICFQWPGWYSRTFLVVAGLATLLVLYVAEHALSLRVPVLLAGYGFFVLAFCCVCHGELVRLRPARRRLTLYYLAIALGGALGGAFVSLLAPAVFPDVWEFHLTIVAGWLAFAAVLMLDRTSPFHVGNRLHFCGLVALGLFAAGALSWKKPDDWGGWAAALRWLAIAAVALGGAHAAGRVRRWRRMAGLALWPFVFVALVTLVAGYASFQRIGGLDESEIRVGRNFYGVLRLRVFLTADAKRAVQLRNGNISHGVQVTDEADRLTPTAYYVRSSGVGLAADNLMRRKWTEIVRGDGASIGVLGLGVGTMAAYARVGDHVRFYDINPLVIALSQGVSPIFTFVRDCRGAVTIVPGDARLSLEAELAAGEPQDFDLLVLDVFSGDAIPLHLLTSESFDVYAAHLRDDDAVLAVHVSNRFLNLEPAVVAQARRLGLQVRRVHDDGQLPVDYSTTWLLLARDPAVFEQEALRDRAEDIIDTRAATFTDRFSNLFQILK